MATVAVAVVPALKFAYRSPGAHMALETAATLAAGLAAFILLGRFAAGRERRELALSVGLLLLAVANLVAAIAPAFSGLEADRGSVWLPLTAHLVAAIALLYAARSDDPTPVEGSALRVVLAIGALTAIVLACMAMLAPELPTGLGTILPPTETGTVNVEGSAGLIAVQLLVASALGLASLGFAARARVSGDELLGWLAIGTLLAALARVDYTLFPSVYSEFVFVGDILRLTAYGTILIGALRQISVYQRTSARTATVEERGRIARDLHDDFAQDLAFIAMSGRRLAERVPDAEQIAAAAERALRASRGAIFELLEDEGSLAGALGRLATTLTGRNGTRLVLDLDEGAEVDAEARQAMLRVLSEAISNATRHGGASEIAVTLRAQGSTGTSLAIRDDGSGFDVGAALAAPRDGVSGLGLAGMRERIERLGGEMAVRSAADGGGEVEVRVP